MGRGVSIQTQTITKPSKAAGGRLSGSRLLGGFWVKGSSWSITSCAQKLGLCVSGGEARQPARRDVRDCVGMPTRVVFLCDSDARPPSRLGRADDALWARDGSLGFVCWGRVGGEGSARCESRRLHGRSGGVTGLE